MYTLKIFSATAAGALQDLVNDWLRSNKDILIHSSSVITNAGESSVATEYIFHLVFTGAAAQEAELKEMAAAVTQEQSLEVKEINPEILKPSS